MLVLGACSFDAHSVPSDGGIDTKLVIDAPLDAVAGCGVAEIAAAGNHACARRTDGRVFCWGSNNTYELGNVVTTKCTIGGTMYACSASPLEVMLDGASALGLGNSHSCAATATGTSCWGYDKYGAFGDGTTATTAAPHLVPQRAGATSLAGGVYHTCSISGGDVSCSGENVAGEVGDNSATTRTTAVQVLAGASFVAGGEYTSCAIDTQQQLWCWGHNYFSIDATSQNKLTPSRVTGIPTAIAVAAGRDHLCAIAPDHTLTCRGGNALGQLGPGTLANIAGVSAHHNHTCVFDTAGAVSCFGESYGAVPMAVTLPRPTIQLSSGVYFDCALTDDHAAYCWGDDSFGELGDSTPTSTRVTTPVNVSLCP